MTTRLDGLIGAETSIVRRPANGRRFLMFKADVEQLVEDQLAELDAMHQRGATDAEIDARALELERVRDQLDRIVPDPSPEENVPKLEKCSSLTDAWLGRCTVLEKDDGASLRDLCLAQRAAGDPRFAKPEARNVLLTLSLSPSAHLPARAALEKYSLENPTYLEQCCRWIGVDTVAIAKSAFAPSANSAGGAGAAQAELDALSAALAAKHPDWSPERCRASALKSRGDLYRRVAGGQRPAGEGA